MKYQSQLKNLAQLVEEEIRNKYYPFNNWFENFLCNIRYYRLIHILKYNIYYKIKYFFQKILRGYSDPEWYSFNSYFFQWALPKIKHLRNNLHGHPIEFSDNPKGWEEVLDQIIKGFELQLEYDLNPKIIWTKERENKINLACTLFGKYVQNMWD